MPGSSVILWFRNDLRLRDNPALVAALERARALGAPLVPVYILDDAAEGPGAFGGASRWRLHHALASLDVSLRAHGSRLHLARGDAREILFRLVTETGAQAVYWNRRYEPIARERDAAIKRDLVAQGIEAASFNGSLLFEPHEITNAQGGPFQVFTPFWKRCRAHARWQAPQSVSFDANAFMALLSTAQCFAAAPLTLEALALLPTRAWAAGFGVHGGPGEAGAAARLKVFLNRALSVYAKSRDIPGEEGTSGLSAALRFGEISPRRIRDAVEAHARAEGLTLDDDGPRRFLTELGWREFAHHLLYHFPRTPEEPLRPEFFHFPWARDPGDVKLKAWRRGLTGYPFVDAGMRQLWRTGWMHNRARMVTASFLVKHLRLPWQRGAEWFRDTLVDADLANNTLGWQWVAGCGADAAPYFRIFAPVTQGQRFDPDGAYVRACVPELAKLPAPWIHAPWKAPADVLAAAGVVLGKTYPFPVVDHAAARADALKAFALMKESAAEARREDNQSQFLR